MTVSLHSGFTTDDARRRAEATARDGGYRIDEWLVPSATGGLRVLATTMRDDHSLGFKWDGDDMNVLVARLISLDWSMRRSVELIGKGKLRPNRGVVQ